MGKEWAEARRAANVARLGATLATALAGREGITFELGCGHGHWLAAYAAAHPDEFCVGIDLITHRVERSVRKQTLGRLGNVVFLKAEATEFLEALPPATVTLPPPEIVTRSSPLEPVIDSMPATVTLPPAGV